MAKIKKVTGIDDEPKPKEVARYFGLMKNPVKVMEYRRYFLVTLIEYEGGTFDKMVSHDSWFMWEALHHQEKAQEMAMIELRKGAEA